VTLFELLLLFVLLLLLLLVAVVMVVIVLIVLLLFISSSLEAVASIFVGGDVGRSFESRRYERKFE